MIILLKWENVSLALEPSAGRIKSITLDKFLLLHNEKELCLIPMISDAGILKTTRKLTVRAQRFMLNFRIITNGKVIKNFPFSSAIATGRVKNVVFERPLFPEYCSNDILQYSIE